MTRADLKTLLSLRQQAQEARAAAAAADHAFNRFAADLAQAARAELADGDGVAFTGSATWTLDDTAITLRHSEAGGYRDRPWIITDVLTTDE